MADSKLTALTALTEAIGTDLIYIVDDPSGTPVSKKITVSDLLDLVSFKTVEALGSNATSYDVGNRYRARATATYTASTTLTFSNASNLTGFSMQITNTNANVLTFSGVTLYFKSDDLPDGVSFATNALTFPADSAVKYNLVAEAFDGSTFDCKIEIR